MVVFRFEEGVWGTGVFLFEEVGCRLLVVKITVAVMGLAVILVVGILMVVVVVKEVVMMVVLGTEWGYGQGLQEWLEYVRGCRQKRSLLRMMTWVVRSVSRDQPAR